MKQWQGGFNPGRLMRIPETENDGTAASGRSRSGGHRASPLSPFLLSRTGKRVVVFSGFARGGGGRREEPGRLRFRRGRGAI